MEAMQRLVSFAALMAADGLLTRATVFKTSSQIQCEKNCIEKGLIFFAYPSLSEGRCCSRDQLVRNS